MGVALRGHAYIEVELIRLQDWMRVGFARATLAADQLDGASASTTTQAWMLDTNNGFLCAGAQQHHWDGRSGFCAGDKIGLSLVEGELTVFKNGERQGLCATGLPDFALLCPAIELRGVTDAVVVTRREEGVPDEQNQ